MSDHVTVTTDRHVATVLYERGPANFVSAATVGEIADAFAGRSYEMIFVDDASRDGTGEIVARLAAEATTIINTNDYGRAVYDMALRRSLIRIGEDMVNAAFDAPYQKWNWLRKLKMTREEIKREMKESEGSPEVKGRIRQMQMQMSQRRMMEALPTADVVLMNPTHYAVALKYEGGKMRAPVVVAKGVDEIWCISVNDAFVMGAWGREQKATGVVRMMADGNAAFTKALGLDADFGAMLELDRRWAAQAIAATGNYGEIFERNLGSQSALDLERGLNAQWNAQPAGLIYGLPIR